MPIKCRAAGNLYPPNASDGPDDRYFYKAVTPAAFSTMRGKVGFIDAAEWARAKQSRKEMLKEKGRGSKRLTALQREVLKLKTEGGKWVNLYFQLTHPMIPAIGDLTVVASRETIKHSEVMLVPPTTTDSDVQALVEPLARKHPLPTLEKRIMQTLRYAHYLRDHRNRLSQQATAHLATLTTQALRKPGRNLTALGPRQSLPEPVTATTMTSPRSGEATSHTLEDLVFFKAVLALNPEMLREGDVQYVLAEEWIEDKFKSVRVYERVGASDRRRLSLPPGTVAKSDEGRIQRDNLMLVPPNTNSATMRKMIERTEKSDSVMKVYRKEVNKVDAEMRTEWRKIAVLAAREKSVQKRLLRDALAKKTFTSFSP